MAGSITKVSFAEPKEKIERNGESKDDHCGDVGYRNVINEPPVDRWMAQKSHKYPQMQEDRVPFHQRHRHREPDKDFFPNTSDETDDNYKMMHKYARILPEGLMQTLNNPIFENAYLTDES